VLCEMNGINGKNGITLSKDGNVYLKKKQVQRYDDPELDAEVRYAKENGLEIPKALESAKPASNNPRALSQRNRSKSTSDVKASPPKIRTSKAERKARNRAVSGCWGKKDGNNRFDYGMEEDFGELDEEYEAGDYDDTIVDGDEYVDYVFKFDIESVRGSLAEYFNNGSCECVLSELTEHLYNNDTSLRVTKEVIIQSLDFDHSHVGLGYRLLVALLKHKKINEKVICSAFEEILSDELDNLSKDMPRAKENMTLFIAKTVNEKVVPRILFDDITSKLNGNRFAVSCALEVYLYLNNPSLLKGKFETCGGFEPLEKIDDQMEKIVREFLVSNDFDEVSKRLTDLHVKHYNHKFTSLLGYHAINMMNETLMDKLAKLLKYLIDTGCLLESSVKPGFEHLFKSLNEIYIDIPAAYSLCELWVKKCDKIGILNDEVVSALPKPSGKRARTLSESDETGKIFVIDTPVVIENGV